MLGATRLPVAAPEAAAALVKRAAAARAVESTAMNAVSSRSHSVFMLYISGHHEGSGQRLQGALNLVDLAGRWGPGTAAISCSCTRQDGGQCFKLRVPMLEDTAGMWGPCCGRLPAVAFAEGGNWLELPVLFGYSRGFLGRGCLASRITCCCRNTAVAAGGTRPGRLHGGQ